MYRYDYSNSSNNVSMSLNIAISLKNIILYHTMLLALKYDIIFKKKINNEWNSFDIHSFIQG